MTSKLSNQKPIEKKAMNPVNLNTTPSNDPISINSHSPTKLIISNAHLKAFTSSDTHTQLLDFINQLNHSVIGLPLDHPLQLSAVSSNLSNLFSPPFSSHSPLVLLTTTYLSECSICNRFTRSGSSDCHLSSPTRQQTLSVRKPSL